MSVLLSVFASQYDGRLTIDSKHRSITAQAESGFLCFMCRVDRRGSAVHAAERTLADHSAFENDMT
jgi:hypothetical protein